MTVADARAAQARGVVAARRWWPGWAAVAVWAAGIAAAFAVGWHLRRAGLATEDALPPLHARPRGRPLTWGLLPAAGVAAVAVAALPAAAARLAWRWLPPLAWAVSAAWAAALAVSDGPGALAGPLEAPTEYPAGLAQVRPDPLEWVRTFTERLGGYTTHVRGHPPLPTLVLWLLEEAGLGGTGWAAALVVAAGSSAAAAIVVTLRCVAGEGAARAAVPFVALAPTALWIATSMDALFLGVGAWGTALVALASRPSRRRLRDAGDARGGGTVRAGRAAGSAGGSGVRGRGGAGVRGAGPGTAGTTGAAAAVTAVAAAAAGGLLLGCLPYLSYGLLPLSAVPLAVLVLCRPRAAVLVALAAGLVVVPAVLTAAGFWWPDGVRATLETYLVSRGSARRSYSYFVFADLAVLGLLAGPAVAFAMPGTLAVAGRSVRAAARAAAGRGRRVVPAGAGVAVPVCAALAGILALDVSGVVKGEVERIWLPFAAWLPAAVPLGWPGGRAGRWWLAAQAVTALAVQALVLSEW
ncbi:hypothetical protein AGRA3207_000376 [Actinomadura graeca]|uniref:Integral membrane protein n=1 Tax=Actinomadura graeca TaxID=2750812 RepID=A0ABX8QM54_9ACTN|nr:hypothetical protein [Actinomadura graeca]QXJ19784.1 hypothetical protein AGRA3207_000376 [Actinomadura graeca]